MIGIIGAMAVEVEEILDQMEQKHRERVSGLDFYTGVLNGTACVTAQCNPGKVNAALCAEAMLLRYQPKAVVNIGVAGGIGGSVKIGDIVLSLGTVQHDVDTSALGDPVGLISGMNLITVPTCAGLNEILKQAAVQCGFQGNVYEGVVASGDQFIGSPEKLRWIERQFGASACEMESGSIAQVCYINGVECTALRCISDHADNTAGVDFVKFAEFAAHQTTDILRAAMPALERRNPREKREG